MTTPFTYSPPVHLNDLASKVVAFELRPPDRTVDPIVARRVEVAVRVVLDMLARVFELVAPPARDRGPVMITATGRAWYPFDPLPEDVHLDDLAPMLAKRARWSGATHRRYSVAEHSCRVAERVAWRLGWHDLLAEVVARFCYMDRDLAAASVLDLLEELDTKPTAAGVRLVLAALLHDAAEAYTPDIPRPIKATRAATPFVHLEALATYAVGAWAGCLEELEDLDPRIKAADDELLALERRELLPDWHPSVPLAARVTLPAPPSIGPSSTPGELGDFAEESDHEWDFRAYFLGLAAIAGGLS
jgi:hypothetical protein